MSLLNKNEQKFLFEELAPIQFECLKDSEEKDKFKFFFESHKIENHTPFKEFLEKKQISKEKYFFKALYDTLNDFFDDKIKEQQDIKFKLLDNHKKDLLYLLDFDIFNNQSNNVVTAIYLRVLLRNFFQTINSIKNYRDIKSDSFGTAYFNNPSNIAIQHELNNVNYQLNQNSFFSAISTEDKDRLKVSKSILSIYQENEQKGNLLNILNTMHSFATLKIDITKGQIEGVNQSFKYLNGLPCSKSEIVRSFFIKASIPYKNHQKIDKTRLCKIIKDIGKTFFYDIVFNENSNKYNIGISPKYLAYKTYIKTPYFGNLIYKYDKDEKYHFLFNLNLNEAIDKYTSILIEEGNEEITQNKYYKSTLKKLFKQSIFPIF